MPDREYTFPIGEPGECWEWPGRRSKDGYGRYERTFAHRIAWERANGPIPKGLFVLHHCDNPPCVNPAHLWVGTHADNMADMRRKGRDNYGRPPWTSSSKMTMENAREIRRRYAAGGETIFTLADSFGVSKSLVSLIIRGERWT